MTSPSKPHSPRSTPSIIVDAVGGPRAVDAVVGGHHRRCTPASFTAASNGTRYSSRSVRSSIRESMLIAFELGVVADEVLDARGDALGLQAAHIGDGDARR